MAKINYRNPGNLAHMILPQNIMVNGDSIFVFDRINMDEGRLYSFNKGYTNKKLVMEVDEGECFFGKDGNVYILYNYEDTLIEVYDLEGNKIKEISLVGQAYFLDVDVNGNIYAVFSQDDDMSIRVYDPCGAYIRDMHSRNMPIISALCCDDEYTYIGGLTEDMSLRVEKINCLSYIKETYDLDIKESKAIIIKILKFGQNVICAVTGKSQNSIIIIDTLSGKSKKLSMRKDIKSIYDINMKGNELLVLCDKGRILVYPMEYTEDPIEMDISEKTAARAKTYNYLSFMVCVKNLRRDFIQMAVRVGVPIAMLSLLYLEYKFNKENINMPWLYYIRFSFLACIIYTAWGVIIKNVAMRWKKKARVDNFLDIYNRIENIDSQVIKNCIFLGLVSTAAVFLLVYKDQEVDAGIFILPLASGLLFGGISYALCMRCLGRLKADMEHMVFELLNFDERNHDLFMKIVKQIKSIKKLGVDKYRIKVITKCNIKESTLKLVKRWSNLRQKITGDTGELKYTKDSLVFDLNLKNRDIRYSRVSLIEDFICYIAKVASISSIIIENGEDEEGKA